MKIELNQIYFHFQTFSKQNTFLISFEWPKGKISKYKCNQFKMLTILISKFKMQIHPQWDAAFYLTDTSPTSHPAVKLSGRKTASPHSKWSPAKQCHPRSNYNDSSSDYWAQHEDAKLCQTKFWIWDWLIRWPVGCNSIIFLLCCRKWREQMNTQHTVK